MIVNHHEKYIFVGFHHSASSAISKELMKVYGGEPLLHKHANIPLLLKVKPELNIDDYFVFGVFRNPVDMVFTMYNKLLTNAHGIFTDPEFFLENGGFVSANQRKMFALVHQNEWTFEQYVKHRYKMIPYDNDFSLSHKYLDSVIKFTRLNDDFHGCLKAIGLTPIRDLPVFNRTKKTVGSCELSRQTLSRVFGPFLRKYALYDEANLNVPVSAFNMLRFQVFSRIRKMKRMRVETRREAFDRPGSYYD